MTGTDDRLVPRTHSTPQAEARRGNNLLDMENDVRASREMADALYVLAERAAVDGVTERDLAAILRCASVLQDHTTNVLVRWEGLLKVQLAA